MPRLPDPGMEQRILNAAERLWKKGGEQALTMRAVAAVAGTNTPTVYRRFTNRHEIVLALAQKVQERIFEAVQISRSTEETCTRYLDFALRHPQEYKLFCAHASDLLRPLQSRGRFTIWNSKPIMELVGKQLAQRLGGSVAEHNPLSLALWELTQGTAILLSSNGISAQETLELRCAFERALHVLVCRL